MVIDTNCDFVVVLAGNSHVLVGYVQGVAPPKGAGFCLVEKHGVLQAEHTLGVHLHFTFLQQQQKKTIDIKV